MRFLTWIEITLPLILSGITLWVMGILDFNPQLTRFEKILDGSITFSSILVGFLAAMMGVLVSIKESEVMKRIFDVRSKGLLAFYLSETIFLGFIVVVSTCIMYLFIERTDYQTPFIVWQISLFWFVTSSIRIIIIMLFILFKSNVSEARPDGNNLTDVEREQSRINNMKDKLTGIEAP